MSVTISLSIPVVRATLFWAPHGPTHTVLSTGEGGLVVAPPTRPVPNRVLAVVNVNDQLTFSMFLPFPVLVGETLYAGAVVLRARAFGEDGAILLDLAATWADLHRGTCFCTQQVSLFRSKVVGVGVGTCPTPPVVSSSRSCTVLGMRRPVSADSAWVYDAAWAAPTEWFEMRVRESLALLGVASVDRVDTVKLLELVFLPRVGRTGRSASLSHAADIVVPRNCDERTTQAFHRMAQLAVGPWRDAGVRALQRAMLQVGLPFVAQGGSCGACSSCGAFRLALVPAERMKHPDASEPVLLRPQTTLWPVSLPSGGGVTHFVGNVGELLGLFPGRRFTARGWVVAEDSRTEDAAVLECAGRALPLPVKSSPPPPGVPSSPFSSALRTPVELHPLPAFGQTAEVARLLERASECAWVADVRPFAEGWVMRLGTSSSWF